MEQFFEYASKRPLQALKHPLMGRLQAQPKLLQKAKESQLIGLTLCQESPLWLLQEIERLGYSSLGWLLHKNPLLQQKQEYFKNKYPHGGLELALDIETPSWLLRELALDEPEIKRAVAFNPLTPRTTLELLSRNEDMEVRRSVAINHATTPKVLAILAKDPCWLVRLGVAENQATPLSLLGTLAQDGHLEVRLQAERHIWHNQNPLDNPPSKRKPSQPHPLNRRELIEIIRHANP